MRPEPPPRCANCVHVNACDVWPYYDDPALRDIVALCRAYTEVRHGATLRDAFDFGTAMNERRDKPR